MTDLFGITRNVVKERYALLTAGHLVPSQLPGWEKAVCHVPISPALGARFSQLLIALDKDGQCAGNTGVNQYFIFLLEGAAMVLIRVRKDAAGRTGQLRLPSPPVRTCKSPAPPAAARLLVFQKQYDAMRGVAKPAGIVGHEREVKGQAYNGN